MTCACARLLLLATLPALAGRQWFCAEGEVVSVGADGGGGGGGGGGPQFASGQHTTVVVGTGQPAALGCHLLHLRDKTVSWVRSRDLQIVCHADVSFTADARVSCSGRGRGREGLHALHVAGARPTDTGLYECQVNTEPKMSLFFNLTVVDEPVPRVVVEAGGGGAVVRGARGGSVTLSCVARYVPAPHMLPVAPLHVAWSRGGGATGADGATGARRPVSVRGGVSLESEAIESRVHSRLTLTELRPEDDGPYTCTAGDGDGDGDGDVSATLTLHVLEDDENHIHDVPLEAMQRDEGGARAQAGAGNAGGARLALLLLLVLPALLARPRLGAAL